MSDAPTQWLYQLRLTLDPTVAPMARSGAQFAMLEPLRALLTQHNATLVCQYDAFAGYVAEAEARGTGGYPLYAWTRAVIEDAAKREKYVLSFTIHVAEAEVYPAAAADALEAALQPLVGDGVITKLARHDTNPANSPQMPARYRPPSAAPNGGNPTDD